MPRPIPALLTTCALTLGLTACGSSDVKEKAKAAPPAATTAAQSTAATPTQTAPPPASGGCKTVEQPPPSKRKASKPKQSLARGKQYTVQLGTSCGQIEIRLDVKHDPKTATNFASLVRTGFYDGLAFHRVVPGFVVQGGDPKGNGTGGVPYKVVEAPPSSQRYTKGVVAMAKTGADKPGTSGSQFFIVVGDDAGLPPEYAVAGDVTKGLDVADAIAALGSQGADGPPSQPVVITKATLKTG